MGIRLADFFAASRAQLHEFVARDESLSLDDIFNPDTVWPPTMTLFHWELVLWTAKQRTGVIPERVAIRLMRDPDPNIVREGVVMLCMVAPRTKALYDEFAMLCINRGAEPEIALHISSGLGLFLERTTPPYEWCPEAFKPLVVDLTKPQNSDDDAPK